MEPTAPDVWTIGRLLQWTAGYLGENHSDTPRLDAELLLAQALGCQRIELYTAFENVPTEEQRTAFRSLVKRRAAGTPVAYLLAHREFYSLDFQVTPDVLIPRPETEFLVIATLDKLREREDDSAPADVVDVGTGSGAVAISLAKHSPEANFTAIDISPKALEVAQTNAATHGVAERISFHEGDLLTGLDESPQFDFVVSNPPYISTSEMAELPREVADYEPHQALEAGPDGTDVIQRLIPQATTRLRPGGYLFIEISPMIEARVRELLGSEAGLELLPTVKDLAGHARIVGARRR